MHTPRLGADICWKVYPDEDKWPLFPNTGGELAGGLEVFPETNLWGEIKYKAILKYDFDI